ncbi:MAG: WYL domain-containing protein [Pseudomonadota bacterium]|nr:WYL domain-containing protein [Pseudomonadota bacterium]
MHQGGQPDKHQLAQQFSVDVRTIERDLHQRLHGLIERAPEGHWQLTAQARSTVPVGWLDSYAQLAGTQHLFPDPSRAWLIRQLQTGPAHTGLHVQPTPSEDLRPQSALFDQLQTAVQQRQPCRFSYKGKPRHAHPLRLIQKNGVWYLAAAEVTSDTPHPKNFSIALIQELAVDAASRFTPRQADLDYIEQQQDVWFTSQSTEVLLRISPQAAHYFSRRPLLPRQQTRTDTDGSLIVTAHIHHPQQLLPVVRYWLPHARILQPQPWHDQLLQELRQALQQWSE